MEIIFLYVTTGNKKEAKYLGEMLLKKKLAACVNIYDNMNSMYWWKDKIEEANETVLIIKTKSTLVAEASTLIKQLHSYECPCILELPIKGGDSNYIEWLKKNLE